jgi:integrase
MGFCIEQELEKVNNRLKAGAVRVQIYRKGNKLYLQGTFPPKPGSTKTIPHQQYLALGVSANPAGLKVTEAKAKEIAALLDLGRFDWTPYSKIKRDSGEKAQTVSEWLKRFEQHYFESRPRTPAKLNTFQKNYWAVLARMPGHEVLTATLIRETVLKESVAGSRNRQIFVMAYASLAKLAGIEVDLKSLKSDYSPKSVSPRDLPTDEAILETIDRFSDPGWRWIYGMLATYGLRDHEVFRLDTSRMKDPPYVVEVLDDSKTGQRLVYPCPSGWVEHWQLWDVRLPKFRTQPDRLDNNALGEKISSKFWALKLPFTPYTLRHAYAVRTAVLGVEVAIASRWMGHSVAVHTKIYHQFLNEGHNLKAWELMRERERQFQIAAQQTLGIEDLAASA